MRKAYRFILLLLLPLFFHCDWGNNSHQVYTGVVEGTVVRVPALTGGKIVQLVVDTGEDVSEGQLMAVIDTTELAYQRKNLNAMMLEIRNQKRIAGTNLKRAEKDLAYVKEKHQRFQDLLKKQSVTQQAVDDLQNQVQNAEAAYNTARQQLSTLDAKTMQIEAQMQSLNKKIVDAMILAPLSGVITQKYYEVGEAIPPLAALVEVIDLDNVWVKIYISETMLPHIKTGQEVEVHPDGTSDHLPGTISWINSKAEFTPKTILTEETRTSLVYSVKVRIKNDERILKQGMPVTVQLTVDN
jgi:HlyD family secretion protein